MRVFKYWAEYGRILDIDGYQQYSKTLGGSNISIEDAEKTAREKLEKAQRIIKGEATKDCDYEVDIVEEIVERLDDKNIVTRNRYGALVLNSIDHVFIDIDQYQAGWLDWIFKPKLEGKPLLLSQITKTMSKPLYARYGFRLYETAKGYRLLITNAPFGARSSTSKGLMRVFKADYLYQWLCVKQNCYRARLTPKPYRIKQKRLKVIFPNRNAQEQAEHEAWVASYNDRSQGYSTCRLVKQQGPVSMNKVIEYHDNISGVQNRYRLA
jgi:hypothetical protein